MASSMRTLALERWHRRWEIEHQDKLLQLTFATQDDLDHKTHIWGDEMVTRHGVVVVECHYCHKIQRRDSI